VGHVGGDTDDEPPLGMILGPPPARGDGHVQRGQSGHDFRPGGVLDPDRVALDPLSVPIASRGTQVQMGISWTGREEGSEAHGGGGSSSSRRAGSG
jgi:hypothetical protein